MTDRDIFNYDDYPQPPVLGPLGQLNDANEPDGDPSGPHFDGKTYDPMLDYARLSQELRDVWDCLTVRPEQWWTLAELQSGILYQTGRRHSEAGISARLRDLRKIRFGAYQVDRKREQGGLHVYRLNPDAYARRLAAVGQR